MNKYKKSMLVFIILHLCLFLTGCWGVTELDELAMVAGLGVDLDEKTDEIILTAQIIKAGEVGTSPGGGGKSGGPITGKKAAAVWVVESRGETFFDAVRAFTFQSSRKLYFPHAKIIVFGKSLAKKGIKPYLNLLIKDYEPRNNTLIAVAENRASEVMEITTELEKIPAYGLAKLIEIRTVTSQSSLVTVHEFIIGLLSKAKSPTASHIQVIEKEGEKKALVKGTAVFKDDKFIGTLNKTETRGLLWMKNKVESGVVVINDPQGKKVSIEIVDSSTEIKSKLADNRITIEININDRGNIAENMGELNLTTTRMISFLEKQQNIIIKNEIESALKKAYELNTDLMGFGDIIYKYYPEIWKKIGAYQDHYWKEIDVKIKVDSKIQEVEMTTKPLTPEEK